MIHNNNSFDEALLTELPTVNDTYRSRIKVLLQELYANSLQRTKTNSVCVHPNDPLGHVRDETPINNLEELRFHLNKIDVATNFKDLVYYFFVLAPWLSDSTQLTHSMTAWDYIRLQLQLVQSSHQAKTNMLSDSLLTKLAEQIPTMIPNLTADYNLDGIVSESWGGENISLESLKTDGGTYPVNDLSERTLQCGEQFGLRENAEGSMNTEILSPLKPPPLSDDMLLDLLITKNSQISQNQMITNSEGIEKKRRTYTVGGSTILHPGGIPRIPGVRYNPKKQQWLAAWNDNTREIRRYFSAQRHGFEKARQLAIRARHEAESKGARCKPLSTIHGINSVSGSQGSSETTKWDTNSRCKTDFSTEDEDGESDEEPESKKTQKKNSKDDEFKDDLYKTVSYAIKRKLNSDEPLYHNGSNQMDNEHTPVRKCRNIDPINGIDIQLNPANVLHPRFRLFHVKPAASSELVNSDISQVPEGEESLDADKHFPETKWVVNEKAKENREVSGNSKQLVNEEGNASSTVKEKAECILSAGNDLVEVEPLKRMSNEPAERQCRLRSAKRGEKGNTETNRNTLAINVPKNSNKIQGLWDEQYSDVMRKVGAQYHKRCLTQKQSTTKPAYHQSFSIGKGVRYSTFSDTWVGDMMYRGKRLTQHFAVKKLGWDGAKTMALKWRQEMEFYAHQAK